MNLLDLCTHVYGLLVFCKLLLSVIISGILLIVAICVPDYVIDCVGRTPFIGMIVAAAVSLLYSLITWYWDIPHKIYELPKAYIPIWAVYSTVVYSHAPPCQSDYFLSAVVLTYIVAFFNLFIMRYPVGDSEIRT